MKQYIFLMSLLLCSSLLAAQGAYNYSVTTASGQNKPLNAYQGKKLFVIVLPTVINTAGDSVLKAVDSFRVAQGNNVQIIAVPAIEYGYNTAQTTVLQNWYSSKLGGNIIITQGLYVKKSSGTQQHPLFKWLTDKNLNGHFNEDVKGPKSKYVVWTDGQLAGDFAPPTRMNGVAMQSLF